jgi:arginyl-tRNA synthetase
MLIQEKFKTWIRGTLQIEGDFAVEHPKEIDKGDYACNIALIEGKKQGKNPKDMAGEFVELLEKNKLPEIEKIEVAGPGFINIFLNKEFFGGMIAGSIQHGETFWENQKLNGQKFFIEHTQPNPFKEFHIGHLMNNTIGESIARIIRANGAKVKTASYHGDKGLHVAKAVWAITKGIDLREAYAYGSQSYEEDETAKGEIIAINKKIYEGTDDDIQSIYIKGRDNSFAYFESMYERLGSGFDYHFYESESGEIGKKLVLEHVPKVFQESEGAVVFKGEEFVPKTHTRVFLSSEKLPTYEAKEVGLAEVKKNVFPYDFSLTVTANEQDAFFKVVEVAIGEVFPELKGKLKHVSHGMLKLPSGKMSSRTGSIISTRRLLNETAENVLEKMKDREMSDNMKKEVAEIVAIGAIKYSILHQAIGGDIIFDFDKSLSFEGDSGPYLQYSFVRSQSLLQKASKLMKLEAISSVPDGWTTTNLERLIARFGEVVERAGTEYAPHYIATYLTELASSFNGFYAGHKIVDENDPTSPYRLAITESFSGVMKKGLYLLGIKVPAEM